MIETHICEECAPAVSLEAARQELGSPSQPIQLCEQCTENLERLFEPPVTLPWYFEEFATPEPGNFENRKFDIVQEVLRTGKAPRYFVRADLFPLY